MIKKFRAFFGRFLDSSAAVPLALLGVCLGAYGLLVPWIGYYGDDLSYAWLAYKSHEIRMFFEGNRPFFGEYFSVLTRFLGPAPWHWQVVELFCRWASALAFWYLLRLVWPRHTAAVLTAAALFALYPGFWLNAEALTFHPFFLQLGVFLLSLVCSVLSLRSPRFWWAWTLAALAGALINLWVSEYFYTLELVRAALIWVVMSSPPGQWKRRLGRAVLLDAPFLALFGVYMGLRMMGTGNYTGNYSLVLLQNLRADPWNALLALLGRMAQDIWSFSLYAFGQALTFPGLENRSLKVIALFLAAILLVALLWFAWMRRMQPSTRTLGMAAAGLLCLLLAGGPIWAAGLRPLGDAGTSRFSMAFMAGACLLAAGLIGLIPLAWLRSAAFAVLTAACLAFQLLLGFTFVQQVDAQADFLWQLAERMPQLKPGTTLITNLDLLEYNTDNSNGALVNWLYNPQGGKRLIDYYVVQDLTRIGEIMGEVKSATVTQERHSIGEFKLQSVVVIRYHYPSCLRILDAELDMVNPYFPLVYRKAARLTDYAALGPAVEAALIPRPPKELFGNASPPDNWCSDYQKASRAAQSADWKQVAAIGDRALARTSQSTDALELLVYIEGYGRTGAWQRAGELLQRAAAFDKLYNPILCLLKNRLLANTPESPQRTQALATLACPAAP
jgi:hypothetical protein